MGSYLVQDPYHPYVQPFVERIRAHYGHRPIAFFTDPKERYYRRDEVTVPTDAFAAIYELDARFDPGAFAALIKAKHPDVVGVLPYSEQTIDTTAALLPRLGLTWNDADTLSRFRRKADLKAWVRDRAPSVRLNLSETVGSVAEVMALGTCLPAKFILKPEDGYGSRGVHVFTHVDQRSLAEVFATAPGRYVLEEFLDGPLYTVDGLVDATGAVHIWAVFSSGRQAMNGCPVVYADGFLVPADTELFATVTRYASDVMRATGLRRSPFHMELIVDPSGPCLVEVGARLIGDTHAFTIDRLHGDALDVFDTAAQAYFTERCPAAIDHHRYNSVTAAQIYGASDREGLVYSVEGVRDVEALASFDRWIVQPHVGQQLRRTTDLFSVPYSAVLVGPRTGPSMEVLARTVHSALSFNGTARRRDRLRVDGAAFGRRARNKLGWLARSGVGPLRPQR